MAAGFDALDQCMAIGRLHGIDHVHAGLIDCQDVCRGADAHIGCNDRFGIDALAVAGDGHVAQDVDVDDLFTEVICHGFGGFRHALHEFLFGDAPDILTGDGMNGALAAIGICAANADVLIGATEAAVGVAFEVGQHQHGIVILQIFAKVDLSFVLIWTGLHIYPSYHTLYNSKTAIKIVERAFNIAILAFMEYDYVER